MIGTILSDTMISMGLLVGVRSLLRESCYQKEGGGRLSDRVRIALIVVVTLVWALNATAPLVIRDYKPVDVNEVFMLVIGTLVLTYRKKNGNDDDDSNTDKKKEVRQ